MTKGAIMAALVKGGIGLVGGILTTIVTKLVMHAAGMDDCSSDLELIKRMEDKYDSKE